MKIIGKGTDYYDCMLAYGRDEKLVFNRVPETVEYNSKQYKQPRVYHELDSGVKVRANGSLIIVGEKQMRVISVTMDNKLHVIYDTDELTQFVEENKLTRKRSGNWRDDVFWDFWRPDRISLWLGHNAKSWLEDKTVVTLPVNNVITGVTESCHQIEGNKNILTALKGQMFINGPFLKDIPGFALRVPADEAYTLIMNKLMVTKTPETVEISDKSKLKKAGFDNVTSFRHRK